MSMFVSRSEAGLIPQRWIRSYCVRRTLPQGPIGFDASVHAMSETDIELDTHRPKP